MATACYVLDLPMAVVPKGNLVAYGKHSMVDVNDKKIKNLGSVIGLLFREKYGSKMPFPKQAVKIEVTFFFPRPNHHFTRKGGRSKTWIPHYVHSPDVDKCSRTILDALTGLVYEDDRQVVELTARKFYDDGHRIYLKIQEVTEI